MFTFEFPFSTTLGNVGGESGVVSVTALRGRPRFGLAASSFPSRLYAGLQSAHDLNSLLTSPLEVSPTLISKVLREGLEMTLNGPLKRGSSPLVSCCLTYKIIHIKI